MQFKDFAIGVAVVVAVAAVAKVVGAEFGRASAEKELASRGQVMVPEDAQEPSVYPNGYERDPAQAERAARGARVQKAMTCVERLTSDLIPLNAGVCDQPRIRVQWLKGQVVMEGADIGPPGVQMSTQNAPG